MPTLPSPSRVLHIGPFALEARLCVPPRSYGLVVLVHDTPIALHDGGNRFIAEVLQAQGLATLSATWRSEDGPAPVAIELAQRVGDVLDWAQSQNTLASRPWALLGLGCDSGALLAGCARIGRWPLRTIVLFDGNVRTDDSMLSRVRLPMLLVERADRMAQVRQAHEALRALGSASAMEVVRTASSGHSDAGVREAVARAAYRWLQRWLLPSERPVAAAGQAVHDSEPDASQGAAGSLAKPCSMP